MKTLRTILVACAFGTGLAACGDATRVVAPEAPRHDGGFTAGEGHRATSDTTSTDAPPTTDAERGGGFTIGSGG